MTIARKLLIGIGFLGAVLFAGGYVTVHQAQLIQANLERIEGILEPLEETVTELGISALDLDHALMDYASDVSEGDTTSIHTARAAFTRSADDFLAMVSAVHPFAETDSETVALVETLVGLSEDILNLGERRRHVSEAVDRNLGRPQRIGSLSASLEVYDEASERLNIHLTESAVPKIRGALLRAADNVRTSGRSTIITILVGTFITILVAGAFVYLLLRSLRLSMKDLREGTARIGAGDLSYRPQVNTKDELGNTSEAFNKMATARQAAERQQRETEQKMSVTLECAHVGAWEWNVEKYVFNLTDEFLKITGHLRSTFPTSFRGILELIWPEDRSKLRAALQDVIRNRTDLNIELRIIRPDGEMRWLSARGSIPDAVDGIRQPMFGTISDITERMEDAAELRRSNRAYRVLSSCNESLVRATDEQDLLSGICAILTEIGEYRLAWIGFAEQDDNRTVRPVVSHGIEDGYIQSLQISWADIDLGRGPIGTAIRTGTVCSCNDIPNDPAVAPWREAALRDNYASMIALPLFVEDAPFGALLIYSTLPDAFDEQNEILLTELAQNLSFGIISLRTRKAREDAESNLATHIRRQSAVAAVGRRALAGLELSQLIDYSVKRIARLLGVDFVSVLDLHQESNSLVLRGGYGWPSEQIGSARVDAGSETQVAYAVRLNKPINVTDFENDSRFKDPSFYSEYGINSGVCVPIGNPDEPSGVLGVHSKEYRKFSEDETFFVQSVAYVLSSAIERVTTEENLRRHRSLLMEAQKVANLVSFQSDFESGTTWWSEELFRLFGRDYGAHNPTREDFIEALHPEDRKAYLRSLQKSVETKQPLESAFRMIKPDGKIGHFVSMENVVENESGEVVGMIGTIQDITEQKHAELRIGRQEALLDQSRDAIIVLSALGAIEAWYKGAENLFGWRSEDVVGKDIQSVWTAEEEMPLGEVLEQVSKTGEWTGTLVQIREDGREVNVQSSWTRISEDESSDSVLVICSDVTEFKKLEQQFFRSQRLESLGTLAGGIAHDLNNVLGPIFIASDLLAERVDDTDSMALLRTIDDSARRGADIVKQVLSFSRGAEGEKAPIQMRHILKESTRLCRETFPRTIEFVEDIDSDLPLVKGDGTQLHQIIMNLLLNARDAMKLGGEIRVSARHETISDAEAIEIRADLTGGDYVHLSVTDTGSGISPGVLDRIFEPFFTTKVRERGTGLGLSTVKAITESHDGAIVCESEPGHGSRFDVYLPAIDDGENVDVRQDEKTFYAPTLPGKWVLVVDDEPVVLKTTRRLLESKELLVATAPDGAEALAMIVKHPDQFDLIVTDMAMPIMDGAATIRAVRKLNPAIPIIAMSGLTEIDVQKTFAGDENLRFIPKPFRSSELLGMISELVETRDTTIE